MHRRVDRIRVIHVFDVTCLLVRGWLRDELFGTESTNRAFRSQTASVSCHRWAMEKHIDLLKDCSSRPFFGNPDFRYWPNRTSIVLLALFHLYDPSNSSLFKVYYQDLSRDPSLFMISNQIRSRVLPSLASLPFLEEALIWIQSRVFNGFHLMQGFLVLLPRMAWWRYGILKQWAYVSL